MRPVPTMPIVFPFKSKPSRPLNEKFPRMVRKYAWWTLRERARIKAKVCSATVFSP